MTTEAQRRASHNWYLRNRERQIQKSMEWQKKVGKEKVLENHKLWYANRTEEQKEINRQKRKEWYASLPEERKEVYRNKSREFYWKKKAMVIV